MKFIHALVTAIVLNCTASALAEGFALSTLLSAANDHPFVRASRADRDSALFEKEAAEWRRFPTSKLDASNKFEVPNATTFTIEQPLWSGGSITASIASAEENLSASKATVDEALLSTQREIARNSIELNRLNRQRVIADKDVQALKFLNETMALRVKNQISPLSELTTVQARLSQANSQRFQIDGGIKRTQVTLFEATGLRVDALKPINCSVTEDFTLERLLNDAIFTSPTLARLTHESARNRFNVDQANAEWLPRIVLGFENRLVTGTSGNDSSTVYIALRHQLNDGLSSRSRIASARAKVHSAEYAYIRGKGALNREVHALVEAYASASNQIQPLEELVRANESLMVSYLAQYKVGKKSWLDVMNAQREFTQAQYSLVDAKSTRCVSAIELGLLTANVFFIEQ